MVISREDELWALIRFNKKATLEQIKAWCQELIAMGSPSKEDRVVLEEMLQELDLIERRIDIFRQQIKLLFSKENRNKGKRV